MSNCCSTQGESCLLPRSEPGLCPACGEKGKSVATLTVKNLVRDHCRVIAGVSYSFCRKKGCQVVYFSDQGVFDTTEIKVRVGIKENDDPIPLCYCFGYTRDQVRTDIESRGSTAIPERIKAEIQGGFCACEVKNPSGDCCLGNVMKAIQDVQNKRAPVATHS
jgi:CopZ-like zinc binding protein